MFQIDRGNLESDDHKHHKSHNKIDVMKDIDAVPSNVQSARQEALLYVFEDNEARKKKKKKKKRRKRGLKGVLPYSKKKCINKCSQKS